MSEEKRESVTYLAAGANPAKSPVYIRHYTKANGDEKWEAVKFRFNGARGQLTTTNPIIQDFLDNHPHLTKEGLLTRHVTASITHKEESTAPEQHRGPVSVTPTSEEPKRRGRPPKTVETI